MLLIKRFILDLDLSFVNNTSSASHWHTLHWHTRARARANAYVDVNSLVRWLQLLRLAPQLKVTNNWRLTYLCRRSISDIANESVVVCNYRRRQRENEHSWSRERPSLVQRHGGHIGRPSPLPVVVPVIEVTASDRAAAFRQPAVAIASTKLHHGYSRNTPIPWHSLSWTGWVAILAWCDMRRLGGWSGPSVRRITPTSRVNHSDTFKISCRKCRNVLLRYGVIACTGKVLLWNAHPRRTSRRDVVRARQRDPSVRDSESVVSAQWFSW